jgi:predicted  nucleic acid-binding Zn-ribbon protein
MDNEMNVSLGLDLSNYQKSIDSALKIFNGFQTSLNDVKLGFDTSQTSELHKIFTDIRSTALKELDKIQKRINTLSSKGSKLDITYEEGQNEIKRIEQEIETTWNPKSRAKLENQLETLKQKLSTLDGEIILNEDEITEAKKEYDLLLKELQINPLEFDFESNSLLKFNTQIDNVLNGLKRTGEQINKTTKKTKKFGEEANKAGRQSTRLNLMGRIMSQMRNSIAAAINPLNMFRKGWNQIIMSDSSKFGATFRQIGENILNFVTPAFEKLAQWILNLLAYVNIFLKAVTGGKLDLFAKSAKSSAATAKNAKEINKTTAGFDEINDIGDSGGGDSGGGASPIDMNANIDTTWAEKIKDIGSWIGSNWKIIVAGIAAIAAIVLVLNLAFGKSSKALPTVSSGFSNLLTSLGKSVEIIAILGGLALVIESLTGFINAFAESGMKWYEAIGLIGGTVGIITVAFAAISLAISKFSPSAMGLASAIVIFAGISAVLLTLTGVIKAITSATEAGANVGGTMIAIIGSIIALVAALTIAAQLLQSPLAMAGLAVLAASICAILGVIALTLPTILDACGKFINTIAPPVIEIIKVINQGIETMIYALGTVLPPIISAIGRNFQIVFSGIKEVVQAVGKVMETIFNGIAVVILSIGNSICNVLNTAKNLVTTVLSSILSFINKLGPAVNNFIDNMIKGVTKLINFLVSGIEYLVNTLVIGGVNKIIKAINSVAEYVGISIPTVPKMSIPRFVPRLDVGTGYVPEDMLAVIHQGEAVIPKEFNEKSYFGGTNDETNSLLEILIEKIEEIDFNPYIRVKDVGEASISYINNKSRSTGRSVI